VEDNRAFAEKFDFPFVLLSDPDRSMAKAFGAYNEERPEYAQRYTYVVGPEGKELLDTLTREIEVAEQSKEPEDSPDKS